MLEMAAARCSPRASADGSLKRGGSPGPAGVGVAGTVGVFVLDETGAAGGAGVAAAAAGAGVEGGAAAAGAAGFGAAFGYKRVRNNMSKHVFIIIRYAHLLCHAHDEALLFDFVRLDSVIILQDLACRIRVSR